MLDTNKRLDNLEAGIVTADKKFNKLREWNNLDSVLTNLRERIIDLKDRINTVTQVLETSEAICLQVQSEQK